MLSEYGARASASMVADQLDPPLLSIPSTFVI